MISVRKTPLAADRTLVVMKRISQLRREMVDLDDYLDLLEARAQNHGKRRYTTSDLKAQLRIA